MEVKQVGNIKFNCAMTKRQREFAWFTAYSKKSEWYWNFNPKIDYDQFQKDCCIIHSEFGSECALFLDYADHAMRVRTIDDFFSEIAEKLNSGQNLDTNMPYLIEGDISDFYQQDGYQLCTMIDNHHPYKRLPIYMRTMTENLQDKRIIASGTITFHHNDTSAAIQMRCAEEPLILCACSRIVEQQVIEAEYAHILKPPPMNKKEKQALKREFLKKFNQPFRRVCVIATQNSQGYTDFRSKLNDDCTLEPLMQYDAIEIKNAIEKINRHRTCDCICIVRSGGNVETLVSFSQPEVLQAIHKSAIPIITGIGHQNDDLLCDRVADYNADTPTGAAELLNEMVRMATRAEIPNTPSKQEYTTPAPSPNEILLQQKVAMLERECESLRQQLAKQPKQKPWWQVW